MALQLSVRPPAEHLSALNTLREQAGVQEATLFSARGKVLAYSGNERAALMPDPPGAAALRRIREQQKYSAVEAITRSRTGIARAGAGQRAVSLPKKGACCNCCSRCRDNWRGMPKRCRQGYRDYQELTLVAAGAEAPLWHYAHADPAARAALLAVAGFSALRPAFGTLRRAGRGHARCGAGRFQSARRRWRAATSLAC